MTTKKKAAPKKPTTPAPTTAVVRNILPGRAVSDGVSMIRPGEFRELPIAVAELLVNAGSCEMITQNPDDVGVPE